MAVSSQMRTYKEVKIAASTASKARFEIKALLNFYACTCWFLVEICFVVIRIKDAFLN